MGTPLDQAEPVRIARHANRREGDRPSTSLLRRSRLVRHWTLERAADALFLLCTEQERRQRRGDINAKMISEWERGKHVPDAFWREKLCLLYEASAEELGFVASLPHEDPSSVGMSRESFAPDVPVIVTPGEQAQAMRVLEQRDLAPLDTQASAWLLLGVDHLAHLFDEGWSADDILTSLQTVLQGVQAMAQINRRHLLQLGAAAVVSGIVMPTGSHVSAEERLHLCEALGSSIAAGWNLFHTTSSTQVLAVGQAQLFLIQQNHSLLPLPDRPKLYSSVYNLIGLALQHQGYCQQALRAHTSSYIAALESGDPWFVTQSLLCQANDHQIVGQHDRAIETIEEALRIVGTTDEEHRRSRAHLLGCWADSAMTIEQDKGITARKKLEESRKYLDHLSPGMEFDLANWFQLAGKEAFVREEYAAADEYLDQAVVGLQPNWVVRQILTLFPKMAIYAHQGRKQESFATANQVASALRVVQAPRMNQTFSESISGLLDAFPNDQEVRAFVTETLRQLSLPKAAL